MITIRPIHLLIIVLLLVAFTASEARAQANPDVDSPTQGQVDQLVKLLAHGQLNRRSQAHQTLMSMGPAVLDLLPAESTQLPAEAISRLKTIRQDLYKQVAKQSTAATAISISGDFKLQEVLDQLAQQSGVEFRTDADTNRLIDVAFDQQPFWEVVDSVLDFVKLDIAPFGAEHASQFILVDRNTNGISRSELARYESVFRIAPVRVTKSRTFANPAVDSTKLFLHVSWEPRIQPVLMQLALKDVKAVDSAGRDISPENKDAVRTINLEGEGRFTELSLPLLPTSPEAKSIRSITGHFDTMLPARSESFRFSVVSASNDELPLVYSKAGVDVILQALKTVDSRLVCDLKVHYKNAGRAFESHRGWVFKNPCVLVNAKGDSIKPSSRETIGQGQNFVSFRFEFDTAMDLKRDLGYSIKYFTPTLLVERRVPFTLSGIPLP
ncbi:MAG: hypothetical protein MK006_06810 [Pirellulales bacterium]|nr:hypothetical protein [Pirellulales bacterium]